MGEERGERELLAVDLDDLGEADRGITCGRTFDGSELDVRADLSAGLAA